MGFKENLLKKLEMDRLTHQVGRSLQPAKSGGSSSRVDRETMRRLLDMGDYEHLRERDLDLFCQPGEDDKRLILVLDSELKVYHTTVADVALRKSPTIKEMISIRNAVKILNDTDVVVSKGADTLQRVRNRLVEGLDLNYTAADIDALAADGVQALNHSYREGIVETLTLFAEVLGWRKAPRMFQLAHHHIWGDVSQPQPGLTRMGPAVLYNLMHDRLTMLHRPIKSDDKAAMRQFEQMAKPDAAADLEGGAVFATLKQIALTQKPEGARSGVAKSSQ
ncbi:MAG: hypothetical protein HKP58_01905 [Desulfatitalea sp.]|nr:hypothetical protein [Desulfatitalea sp.]NNJ99142.1 hypothetical protein [Desulfatitalea sp.]